MVIPLSAQTGETMEKRCGWEGEKILEDDTEGSTGKIQVERYTMRGMKVL